MRAVFVDVGHTWRHLAVIEVEEMKVCTRHFHIRHRCRLFFDGVIWILSILKAKESCASENAVVNGHCHAEWQRIQVPGTRDGAFRSYFSIRMSS